MAIHLKPTEAAAAPPMSADGQDHTPRLRSSRVKGQAIRLDGNLDESAWKRAPIATGFVQLQPDEGAPATERSEVRVLYGEKALYIGFRAFDTDPSSIEAQLTRRDQWSFSDWVYVSIDSYNDERTAFQFTVNPKCVKRDAYLFDDNQRDSDWDAVWDVKTSVDGSGWAAEFRIPYSQLRFPHNPKQTWGIQFGRAIARKDETSYWAPLSTQEYAMVSKFGKLWGIDGVEPPRRLEIMPYTMAGLQREPGDQSNPLFEENDFSVSLGMDVKYGVTGDLTLDVTVNPDFGQVEADPAQVNLSAFETFFPERRPFFMEGANIFDFVLGYGPTGRPDEKLFYSRRIGRAPQGWADSEGGYLETPDATTIRTAEKLSGKTASGWTIGLLHAAAAEEEAHIITGGGEDIHEVVEPSTHYGLLRLQKDFRGGHSALGIIATGVFRRSDEAEALHLHTRAITGGFDFRHRFWDDNYQISGHVLRSRVSGSKEAIARTQRAPGRYMQRPDADHVTYDPERTSLEGMSASVNLGRVGGGSWSYGAVIRTRTPGLEVNDIGFARSSDMLQTAAWLGYFQNRQSRYFRRWSMNWNGWRVQSHGHERTSLGTGVSTNFQFQNHWNTGVGLNYSVGSLSTSMLRGGPAIRTDDQVSMWVGGGTDSRKAIRLNVNTNFSNQWESGSSSYSISSNIYWRPSGRIQMSVGASYGKSESGSQWVTQLEADNVHYIFGHIAQQTISLTGRLDVTFTPNLSLQLYMQPFVSAGHYSQLKQVADPRAGNYTDRFDDLDTEAIDGGYLADVDGNGISEFIFNPDFNFKQFRSNAVFRWEYRQGSALFVVWSHGRQDYDPTGQLDLGSDLGELFDAPADDVIMVKVSYWF